MRVVFTLIWVAVGMHLGLVALCLHGLGRTGRETIMPDPLFRRLLYLVFVIPGSIGVLTYLVKEEHTQDIWHWIQLGGVKLQDSWERAHLVVRSKWDGYLDRVNRGAEGMPLVHTEPGKPEQYKSVEREQV